LLAQACDATIKSRAIQVERTILLQAKPADSTAVLPRPLTDEVMEKIAESFRIPANIALLLYNGPVHLPSDSGEGKRLFAHPSLGALVRVTFDRRGVARTVVLYDETFDANLDSAFVASIVSAFPDSTTSQARAEMVRDTIVVDFVLATEPSVTRKQRAEIDKMIGLNRLLELPIGRIALPHFPDAKAGRRLVSTQRYRSIMPFQAEDLRGAVVSLHAVLDTTGRLGAMWIPEATNQTVVNLTLEDMHQARFVPATIGGCPIPVRVAFRWSWRKGTSRPDSEYRPGSIPPPND
jgi:hypothetical protein